MSTLREQHQKVKIKALVNLVYLYCKQGKAFNFPELTKDLGMSSTFQTHLTRLYVIQKLRNADKGAVYQWLLTSEPDEAIIDELYTASVVYNQKMNAKKPVDHAPAPIIEIVATGYDIRTDKERETIQTLIDFNGKEKELQLDKKVTRLILESLLDIERAQKDMTEKLNLIYQHFNIDATIKYKEVI